MPKNLWRFFLIGSVIVVLMLLASRPVFAADPITGDRIVIDEDSDDDLYVMGTDVIVESTINGDLIVFGRSLTLNGTVTGDLIFMGQSLTLNGTVEDDLRVGGMISILNDGSRVGDDLNTGVMALEMQRGSIVNGSAYVGASQAALTDIDGNIFGGANAMRLNGVVGGDVNVGVSSDGFVMSPSMFTANDPSIPTVSNVPPGLTFGPDAEVAGDLRYESTNSTTIPQGVVAGSVTQRMQVSVDGDDENESQGPQFPPMVRYLIYVLGSFILLFVLGLILNQTAPIFLEGTRESLRTNLLSSFAVGLVGYLIVYILVPILILLFIAAFVFFVPLGNAGARVTGILSLLGIGSYSVFLLITNWLAPVIVALVIGGYLYRLFRREPSESAYVMSLTLGLLTILFLLAIPFLGRFVLTTLVGMSGLGAIFLYWRSTRKATTTIDPDQTNPSVKTGPIADRPMV